MKQFSFMKSMSRTRSIFVVSTVAFTIALGVLFSQRHVQADIAPAPLYPCPTAISGWGKSLNLYIREPVTALPNGHAFCAYYTQDGDPYTGVYDRVLGQVVIFFTRIAPTDQPQYDSYGGSLTHWIIAQTGTPNLHGSLYEIVGSTGSKCVVWGLGMAAYYVERECGGWLATMFSYSDVARVAAATGYPNIDYIPGGYTCDDRGLCYTYRSGPSCSINPDSGGYYCIFDGSSSDAGYYLKVRGGTAHYPGADYLYAGDCAFLTSTVARCNWPLFSYLYIQ